MAPPPVLNTTVAMAAASPAGRPSWEHISPMAVMKISPNGAKGNTQKPTTRRTISTSSPPQTALATASTTRATARSRLQISCLPTAKSRTPASSSARPMPTGSALQPVVAPHRSASKPPMWHPPRHPPTARTSQSWPRSTTPPANWSHRQIPQTASMPPFPPPSARAIISSRSKALAAATSAPDSPITPALANTRSPAACRKRISSPSARQTNASSSPAAAAHSMSRRPSHGPGRAANHGSPALKRPPKPAIRPSITALPPTTQNPSAAPPSPSVSALPPPPILSPKMARSRMTTAIPKRTRHSSPSHLPPLEKSKRPAMPTCSASM